MIITAMTAMVAVSLLYGVRAEVSAVAEGAGGEQAYAAAMSGVQRAVNVLANGVETYDNPDMFRNQLVLDDGNVKWYFTLYAGSADGKTLRYGLEDEAGKLNLNAAQPDTLRKLFAPYSDIADPAELADCLMDYTNRPGPPRESGAKQDYYDQLKYPYLIKNGPLGTVEELLLVKGFNARIVYGDDANQNGILDPNEDDGDKTFPPDNADGTLDRGMLGVATVCSYERNVDADGKDRVNINGDPKALQGLAKLGLKKETLDFIKVYRQEGNIFKDPSELLGLKYTPKGTAATQPAGRPAGNTTPGSPTPTPPAGRGGAGGRGNTPGGAGNTPRGGNAGNNPGPAGISGQPTPGQAPAREIQSGVALDDMPVIMDKLTIRPTGRNAHNYGLVNVNTASEAVLAMLPGLDEASAKSIIDAREALDEAKKSTIAWLVTENLLSGEKFKLVAPFITARSFQYRVRCVGFSAPNGRYRMVEAVVDTTAATPRILYVRDITRLGLPAAMDPTQDASGAGAKGPQPTAGKN